MYMMLSGMFMLIKHSDEINSSMFYFLNCRWSRIEVSNKLYSDFKYTIMASSYLIWILICICGRALKKKKLQSHVERLLLNLVCFWKCFLINSTDSLLIKHIYPDGVFMIAPCVMVIFLGLGQTWEHSRSWCEEAWWLGRGYGWWMGASHDPQPRVQGIYIVWLG